MKDHPRSRGVYWISVTLEAAKRGSSPLARGLHGPMAVTRMKARIIPARAGFTPTCTGRAGGPGDHPRSRGVYMLEQLFGDRPEGSSPLARGLPRDGQETTVPNGIIPARAGFTGEATIRGLRRPDHPRSRGVYSGFWTGIVQPAGSSPLARGLRFRSPRRGGATRIIPARAGFTRRSRRRRSAARDHPRSRGVYRVRPVYAQ